VGLTVEPSGKFLRVVETARARFTTLPFVGANEGVPHNKRYVTKLVRVSYLDTNDLTNAVLNRLKSESADIISYRSSLIITDQSETSNAWCPSSSSSTPRRPTGQDLDDPDQEHVGHRHGRPHRRNHARSAIGFRPEAPTWIATPAPPKPQPGPPGDLSTEMTITKIVPDERSNSLIVVANQRAYNWLVSLVHKLDVSPEESVRGAAQDRFHIYNCANANCDELRPR